MNIKIYYENFYQETRNIFFYFKNKYFPFGLKKNGTEKEYINIYNEAKQNIYENIDQYEKETNFKIDESWLNDLALHTQVVI